jgi:hypothetical protein
MEQQIPELWLPAPVQADDFPVNWPWRVMNPDFLAVLSRTINRCRVKFSYNSGDDPIGAARIAVYTPRITT